MNARRARQVIAVVMGVLGTIGVVAPEEASALEEALPGVMVGGAVLWGILDRDGDGVPDFVERIRARRAERRARKEK